jgi:acetyl-CoA acetyltransferase
LKDNRAPIAYGTNDGLSPLAIGDMDIAAAVGRTETRPMANVYVAGTAMTPFTSHAQGLIGLAETVTSAALVDAGLRPTDVGMVFVGNAAAGLMQGQEMVRGQMMLADSPLAGCPIVNVENACASSSTAFHLAAQAIAAGQVDVAIALGVEDMTHPDKLRTFGALASAADTLREPEMFELVDRFALRAGAVPAELTASPLMAHYARKAEKYLAEYGGTPADLAAVVVKSRAAAAANPLAQLRRTTSVQDVLAERLISAPLTRPMCAPVSNGAAAVVVVSERRIDGPRVRVAGTVLVSNDVRDPVPPARVAADRLYATAGVGPNDLDVSEVHDASASAELILMEALRLCEPGQALELVRSGRTTAGGDTPVNAGGGLLSRGHPVGATGCAQIVELTDQLRERAGRRQVVGARIALAQNSGGVLGEDEAVVALTLLEKTMQKGSS